MPQVPPRSVTISSLLVPWAEPDAIAEMETFRIAWEKTHGPTDLTRYYTSRWPEKELAALYELDFEAYFEGLPPFFQEMLRDKVRRAAQEGYMDDMPTRYIQQYLRNYMKPHAPRGR
jgi:hypothetical protein